MVAALEFDELVERFTLVGDELDLLRNKSGATRLAFALFLRYLAYKGRFPRGRAELADNMVEHVARQVEVAPEELGFYDWSGRQAKRIRVEVRRALGFRRCGVGDADKLTRWLAEHVTEAERRPERVLTELLARCRSERIEPLMPDRLRRIVASALHQGEETLAARTCSRLDEEVPGRLEALIEVPDDRGEDGSGRDEAATPLAFMKADPGEVSLDSMLTEIQRLLAVRAVGLPAGAFSDVAPKVLASWRARAEVESPSHLKDHPRPLRLTLLAALVHVREQEIADSLVDLLIATVHRINARAEKKVTKELLAEFRRVAGKETILFHVAEAAVDHPDETIREAVFPAVRGGEGTLRDLVAEYKRSGPTFRLTVKTTLRASYTRHYRRGLIRLLEVLEFRCNSERHRPVIEALEVIVRHAHAGNIRYYPVGEKVPVHEGISGDWADLVYGTDGRGRRRVLRMVYEIATFQALRDGLRCKDIWVVGAERWRNPDEDLPADFEERRAEHYQALRKPLDARAFVASVQEELRAELQALNDALPRIPWLKVEERRSGGIHLSPLEAAAEPRNLRWVKAEVLRQWGGVPLIDFLKEAVLRTGCLEPIRSVAGGGSIPPDVLTERLILGIFAHGTGVGIRSVAAGTGHRHSENDIRYASSHYLSLESARMIAIAIADGTFAIRRKDLWGEGSTAVASDSTHVAAWDQNVFTEWHSRYGGRGVLIYWCVEEKGSIVVHSQLLSPSASEVHAMVDGAIRHGTSMQVEQTYVDSHGQSEIGFGISRILDFELLPRLKRINKAKLYLPFGGERDAYPRLLPALTRPIRWDVIAEQYDSMIKYGTAIRLGTASTEAILRRFTRTAGHPTYQAMLELGRAQKTIFVARYLRLRELQREVEEALNVVESWNRANSVIRYGNQGEFSTNRREQQELAVLCLRILQASLVYVNTLMLQDVLGDPKWEEILTDEDRRGLTPLIWLHVLPYGEVKLNMRARLTLGRTPPSP